MSFSYFHEFFALAAIHFLAVVAPGPDFAVTVRQSVRFGKQVGILTALGIGAGISVHVLYTLIGVGALIHSSPWLLAAAKLAGGAYILYLGIRFMMSKAQAPSHELDELSGGQETQTLARAFLTGFMTNATNPKATLFFLAIFSTVVSADTPLRIQALYGVWMCCVNAAWFVLVSLVFSSPRIRRQFLQLGHWFERVMGVVLIGFAARLLLATH